MNNNEAIEILEKRIEIDRKLRQNSTESDYDKFCENECIAMEQLIKGYRKLQDRVIKYEKTLENLQKETIWKSKIKEKIEGYKKLIKEVQANEEHYNEIPLYEHDIEVLQELMEDK